MKFTGLRLSVPSCPDRPASRSSTGPHVPYSWPQATVMAPGSNSLLHTAPSGTHHLQWHIQPLAPYWGEGSGREGTALPLEEWQGWSPRARHSHWPGRAGQSAPLGKGPEEKQPKGRCLQAQMRPTDMRVRGDGQAGRLAGHRAPKDPQYPSSSPTQPAHHRALLSPPVPASHPARSSDESSGFPPRVPLAPITSTCPPPAPRGWSSLHTDAPHCTHSVTNNHALKLKCCWEAPGLRGLLRRGCSPMARAAPSIAHKQSWGVSLAENAAEGGGDDDAQDHAADYDHDLLLLGCPSSSRERGERAW